MSDVAPDDRDLAIRTMLGEEGSEAGQAGVAAVILNRLAAGSYGGSIGDVVLAPHQFEAWSRQTDDLLTIKRNNPRYVEAGQIFDAVRSGAIPDPTDGATHFYAPVAQAALGRKSPDWAKGQGLKLGSSMFYAPQGRVERKPDVPQTQPVPPAQPGFAAGLVSRVEQPKTSVPNRPPTFLKDATPVSKPDGAQVPNRPPAFLKDAVAAPKPGGASAPGFVEKGASELGRIPTEAPKAIGEMFREGTAAEFGVGQENVARGVAAMRGGPGGWLGGAASDVVGTLQEASSPFVGAANALLGVGGWMDPAMVGGEAPYIASMGDAAKYARAGAVDPRIAAEGRAATEPPAPLLLPPPDRAPPPPGAASVGTDALREVPPDVFYGTVPAAKAKDGSPLVHTTTATVNGVTRRVASYTGTDGRVHKGVPPPEEPIAPPPPAPQRPPAFLPDDARPVARVAEPPIAKPAAEPPVAKPAAPVSKRVGSRIDQPSAQALVDELRKRFGVEKPVPVNVSNAGEPTTFGFLRSNWDKTTNAVLEKFRRSGIVDPGVGTPSSYAITVRSDPSDRALSVGTLLHEFGHVLQNEKYRTASPETRAAILAAFHRETQAFGKLSPEEFPATALDSIVNARVKDLETRFESKIVASRHQEYNQRFNEWFANQVSTWLTTTREATGVVDKFFKGIADAWKDIYRRVTGRQGAAPEIDAYMRGMWDEGKAAEEAPRTASGEATPDRAASRVQMTRGEGGVPHDEDDLIGEDEPLPVAPGDLGAAGAPPGPALPDVPTTETIWEQEDRFNRLAKAPWAVKAKVMNMIDSWPKRMKTAEAMDRFDRFMEDPSFPLTPQERADHDQHIAPARAWQLRLWEEAKKFDLKGIEEFDPVFTHRMVIGKSPQFDRLFGIRDDGPLGGGRLPQSTSSMKPRAFFAIQDVASGERRIVARADDGSFRVVDSGKPAYPVSISKDVKVGDAIPYDKRMWTFEQARTHEIEAATDVRYYRNAGAKLVDDIVRLEQVVDAIHEVERLKSSPEWPAYARQMVDGRPPPGTPSTWREPRMPIFRNWAVEPRLADVIDDFYGHARGSITEKLQKINRWSVATMFWTPAVHIQNVGTHWFSSRGLDWWSPYGWHSFFVDGARAFREVASMGPKYQELLREGNGLLYASASLEKFTEMILKKLGGEVIDLQKLGEGVYGDPAKAHPLVRIARTLGMPVKNLVEMWYKNVGRTLWYFSDVMMMQRVLELERKGMSTRDAIKEAERDIPNYRAHSHILPGVLPYNVSRGAAQVYFNPTVSTFSRYHYAQLDNWANFTKDITIGGKDPIGRSRRVQAMGKIMATGFLMVFAAPVVDWYLKEKIGKKVHLPPRGSTTLPAPLLDAWMQTDSAKKLFPKYVRDYWNDDSDLLTTMNNLFTVSPLLRWGIEEWQNADTFTHRSIREPADVRDAEHDVMKGRFKQAAHEAKDVVAQEAQHGLERTVQPYYALSRIMQGDKGLVKGILEQGLGLTEPNTAGIAAVRRREEKEAGYRRRHPRGPLEELGGILP